MIWLWLLLFVVLLTALIVFEVWLFGKRRVYRSLSLGQRLGAQLGIFAVAFIIGISLSNIGKLLF